MFGNETAILLVCLPAVCLGASLATCAGFAASQMLHLYAVGYRPRARNAKRVADAFAQNRRQVQEQTDAAGPTEDEMDKWI